MPDIKYVCMSDLHLGEEDSLLTNIDKAGRARLDRPSPVMRKLFECLKLLIDKNEDQKTRPTLILCGDVLELALAFMNEAGEVFTTLARQILDMGKGYFEEIYFIPGNHDHHLWELARETQYVEWIKRREKGEDLKPPWHTTHLFQGPDHDIVPSYFLDGLLKRLSKDSAYEAAKDLEIKVRYPNLGIRRELKGPDGNPSQRVAVFTHGHYTESIYQAMSMLKGWLFPNLPKAAYPEILEAENFAWLDFFWSALGRSGSDRSVEAVYESLHSDRKVKEMVENLSKGVAGAFDLPGWGDFMESKLAEWAISKVMAKAKKQERKQTGSALTQDSEKGLRDYLSVPLKNQLLDENENRMPDEVVFVFGHTHKPFAQDFNGVADYPKWIDVYNTGGWVVDSPERQTTHGGAVVLLDDKLNAASMIMYKEEERDAYYRVFPAEATHSTEATNELYNRIRDIRYADDRPWDEFSKIVAEEVGLRAGFIQKRLQS